MVRGSFAKLGSVVIVLTLFLVIPRQAEAVLIASDDSSDAIYNSGLSDMNNGGSGFGAWRTRTNSGSDAGFFTFTADNNNAGGGSIATIDAGPDSNGSTDSWGFFANLNNLRAVGYRSFNFTNGNTSLQVGDTFRWSMDNGGVDIGGSSVGLSLRSGNVIGVPGNTGDSTIFAGSRFRFEFQQGESNYTIVDSAGNVDTGIPFRRTGLDLEFTLTATDTYSLSITDVNSASPLGIFTGTLVGSGTAIESLAAYNRFSGNGSDQNVFFNNFSVTAIPEPSAFLFGGLVCSVLGVNFARKRQLAKKIA